MNIFLLLFGGLQGLLLSLFIIRKKLHRRGYFFLLLYFGVMLLQITLKVMSKAWLWDNWHVLYEVSYFLPLLYGPLIYLFVRELLLHKKLRTIDLLHFSPFIIILFFLLMQGVLSITSPWVSFLFRRYNAMLMQMISLLIYHGLALQYWQQYKSSLKHFFSDTHRLQLIWVRQFIIASLFVCATIALAIFLLFMNYPRGADFRYGFVALTIFIYWISYTALTQPSVFSVIKGSAGQESNSILPLPMLVIHRAAKKYSNSGLSEEYISGIRARLLKVMAEQKPFLAADLTINGLADLVKCNRHQLSQVLNESLHQSFYDYVNRCRVDEARQLLIDPAREEHKISSIAFDAGFNSISTFNEVFKKFTGHTPSQFKNNYRRIQKKKECKKDCRRILLIAKLHRSVACNYPYVSVRLF